MLAALLDWPYASVVNKIETNGGASLRIGREIEGGNQEISAIDLPCVLSIQTGINEPRYVGIRGIRKVASVEIPVMDSEALGVAKGAVGAGGAKVRRIDYFVPQLGAGDQCLVTLTDDPRHIGLNLDAHRAIFLARHSHNQMECLIDQAGEQHRAAIVGRTDRLVLDGDAALGAVDDPAVAQVLRGAIVIAVHVEDRLLEGRHHELQVVEGHVAAPDDKVNLREAFFDARAVDHVDDFVAQGQDLHGSRGVNSSRGRHQVRP